MDELVDHYMVSLERMLGERGITIDTHGLRAQYDQVTVKIILLKLSVLPKYQTVQS